MKTDKRKRTFLAGILGIILYAIAIGLIFYLAVQEIKIVVQLVSGGDIESDGTIVGDLTASWAKGLTGIIGSVVACIFLGITIVPLAFSIKLLLSSIKNLGLSTESVYDYHQKKGRITFYIVLQYIFAFIFAIPFISDPSAWFFLILSVLSLIVAILMTLDLSSNKKAYEQLPAEERRSSTQQDKPIIIMPDASTENLTLTDELKKLKQLKEDGVITEAELLKLREKTIEKYNF